LGTTDFSSLIAQIPTNIDAIFVCLAGADAINFLEQYLQTGRQTPLIGGSTLVDQTVLSTTGELSDQLIGMPWAGPCSDNYADIVWQTFAAEYRNFGTLHAPGLCTLGYYVNTKAALLALNSIGGALDADQTNLRAALSGLHFQTPTGMVKLDHNRQAITPVFINEVTRGHDGALTNRILEVLPEVNSTFGIPEDEYLAIGTFNRDNPPTN
jgi:branched-chain amino acid transport system substrate-binding protein